MNLKTLETVVDRSALLITAEVFGFMCGLSQGYRQATGVSGLDALGVTVIAEFGAYTGVATAHRNVHIATGQPANLGHYAFGAAAGTANVALPAVVGYVAGYAAGQLR